jgi:hypothetical protein
MQKETPPAGFFSSANVFAWLYFLIVVGTYGALTAWNISLPGVYMDGVDPDYLVVKILNPHHQPIVAWLLRGNYLQHRFPVLIQIYHGSHTFWLGLPFFWLFGTTVEGLRATHAVFAIGVLAGLFYLLLRCRLRPLIAVGVCLLLATDPAFSYSFRTQSYITLAPVASVLLSLALLIEPRGSARASWLVSGLFYGLAASSYFIHAFFLPALLVLVWIQSRPMERRGHIRVESVGSLKDTIEFFNSQQSALAAFASQLSVADRLAFAWKMITGAVVGNGWNHSMIFGESKELPAIQAKIVVLVALPYVLWIFAEVNKTATSALRGVLSLPVSFVAIAFLFGSRLGGHHYIVLLPFFYAGLVLSLRAAILPLLDERGGWKIIAATTAALLCVNVFAQTVEARQLEQTRGVGLMSDAINRFAEDLNRMSRKPFLFLGDWGLSMPIAFLTRGNVGMADTEDFALAREMLCTGHDVAVAFINGDRVARRQIWQRALEMDSPTVTPYKQADGAVVFELVTFSSRGSDTSDCG